MTYLAKAGAAMLAAALNFGSADAQQRRYEEPYRIAPLQSEFPQKYRELSAKVGGEMEYAGIFSTSQTPRIIISTLDLSATMARMRKESADRMNALQMARDGYVQELCSSEMRRTGRTPEYCTARDPGRYSRMPDRCIEDHNRAAQASREHMRYMDMVTDVSSKSVMEVGEKLVQANNSVIYSLARCTGTTPTAMPVDVRLTRTFYTAGRAGPVRIGTLEVKNPGPLHSVRLADLTGDLDPEILFTYTENSGLKTALITDRIETTFSGSYEIVNRDGIPVVQTPAANVFWDGFKFVATRRQ